MSDDVIPQPGEGEKEGQAHAPDRSDATPAQPPAEAAALAKLREQLGPELSGLIDKGVTGRDIVSYLREYQTLAQQPLVSKALEEFRRTGRLSLPAKDIEAEDDEYLDPEQREVRALKDQVSRLEGLLREQASGSSVAAASRHFESVADDLALEGEQRQKVLDAVTTHVENLAQAGEAGAMTLRELSKPSGRKSIETVVLHTLGVDGLRKALERLEQRKAGRRRALATDLPGGGPSDGQGDVPDFGTDLFAALRWAGENPERI